TCTNSGQVATRPEAGSACSTPGSRGRAPSEDQEPLHFHTDVEPPSRTPRSPFGSGATDFPPDDGRPIPVPNRIQRPPTGSRLAMSRAAASAIPLNVPATTSRLVIGPLPSGSQYALAATLAPDPPASPGTPLPGCHCVVHCA